MPVYFISTTNMRVTHSDGDDDDDDDDSEDDILSLGTNVNMEEDDDDDDEGEDLAVITSGSSATVNSGSFQNTGTVPHAPGSNVNHLDSVPAHSNTWHPLYIKTKITDGQMKVHQVLMILLPGGIGHTKTEDIEVSLCALAALNTPYLRIGIQWPRWIVSHDFLKVLRETLAICWISKNEMLPVHCFQSTLFFYSWR